MKAKNRFSKKTVLFALSGSIALYKSCDLVRNLKAEGADVICLMTKTAEKFVTPLTFQALSGHPVYTDPFSNDTDCPRTSIKQKDNMRGSGAAMTSKSSLSDFSNVGHGWAVLHTTLADKADLILISPASANLIARLASGMADDIVTSAVLASKAKVLVVPAMNDNMYAHPITQENITKLKRIGYQFVPPIKGDLVCGRVGMGHIAENEQILNSAYSFLKA